LPKGVGLGQGRGPAIAAAGHGGDGLGADDLAQRRHLHRQVVLLDNHALPDAAQQLVLADDTVAVLDQRRQQVEGPGADLRRLTVDQQPALGRGPLEAAESEGSHAQERRAAAVSGPVERGAGLVRTRPAV
jgi:hypothetical protein